ncbi:DUF2339 domain-containing protein [Solitalea sp. MAHUQ-68]|uniref:DUF2339 domain-containing protein n=1 Tax=Solitalea agri TaxID=2953739 RepID=A0A9X2EZV2_9SPHI|nr:DUF2339 domain-containing protein [Solitalea agri]MCO4291525.1 DUF2339 domain-containing protein [Solitalea agri]
MIEALIFILLLVILVVVIQQKNDLNQKTSHLSYKIDQLSELINSQTIKVESKGEQLSDSAKDIKPDVVSPTVKPEVEPSPEKDEIYAERLFFPEESALLTLSDSIGTGYKPESSSLSADDLSASFVNSHYEDPSQKKSFLERNPDLEKYIGENLFNKIGIAILVLGMGFFLKYAIDKNWINEIGRTFIGIVTGGALITIAHRMRKSFAAFSSVLVGGGIAILYFTITIAFQQYQLFSQTIAFIIMVLITGFAVLLSISYDRKELAILAILGGFTSPLMISTGEGNYIVLFSYILILNIGMLVLAYFKKWNILNIICYVFTVIMFGVWLSTKVIRVESDAKNVPYAGALLFATLFYFVFFLMNIINNIKEKTRFNAAEISILLSNTFFYFSAGMLVLNSMKADAYQGLFTALLAVFNLVFAYVLYKNERVDKNLIYLLIGLVLTFCSLVAPIQLHGNYITLFWAAEAVLLLWLSQKSGIVYIRIASVIVMMLMFVSLGMDWFTIYNTDSIYLTSLKFLRPFSNNGFITGVAAIVSVYTTLKLLKNDEPESHLVNGIKIESYKAVLSVISVLLIYILFRLEINYQAAYYFNDELFIIVGCYNYVFIAILLYFAVRAKEKFSLFATQILGIIGLINLIAYPAFYNDQLITLRLQNMSNGFSTFDVLLHFGLVALFFVTLFQVYRLVKILSNEKLLRIFQWSAAICMIFILSSELDHVVAAVYGNPETYADILTEVTHKTGYAILWGVFAFILIYLGMHWKSKNVRIISLSVFAVTLIKLFAFDLRGLSEGGKIAAFLSLGALLLVISFMYQRLKRILLSDESQENNNDENGEVQIES